MKKLTAVIFQLSILNLLAGQCDYSTPRFGVGSEKRLFYGIQPDYNGIQDSLFVDIYYPIGSPEMAKPLVIWAFGGGFFQGKREDFATVCEELAARGIISATIDYRIGFDGPAGLNPPFAYDKAEVLRAAYRGVMDMKGAIRFLKSKHATYGIDLKRVWTGGASAGAIVALNAAYLDKETERPVEAGNIAPIGNKARNDLGSIDGSLNLNGYDTYVQGVFNFFGAVLDTNAIDPSDRIAVFSYHQTNDPVVPCKANTPYFQIPFIAMNYPVAYGTCMITQRFQNIGLDPVYWESWIYNGNQHAAHDQSAIINFMLEHAKPVLCKSITANTEILPSLSDITIFPNPASNKLFLDKINDHLTYHIFTLSGKQIVSGEYKSPQGIDITSLSPGLYLLKIHRGGHTKNFKWIKS